LNLINTNSTPHGDNTLDHENFATYSQILNLINQGNIPQENILLWLSNLNETIKVNNAKNNSNENNLNSINQNKYDGKIQNKDPEISKIFK